MYFVLEKRNPWEKDSFDREESKQKQQELEESYSNLTSENWQNYLPGRGLFIKLSLW